METNNPDQSSGQKEVSSDDQIHEMVEAVKLKDQQLEHKLFAAIPREGYRMLYIFNDNDNGNSPAFGIDTNLGIVSIGREAGKGLLERVTEEGETHYKYERQSANLGPDDNSVQQILTEDELMMWQEAYKKSVANAEKAAEMIRARRELLPKALEFVKSFDTQTETTPATTEPAGVDLDGGFKRPA